MHTPENDNFLVGRFRQSLTIITERRDSQTTLSHHCYNLHSWFCIRLFLRLLKRNGGPLKPLFFASSLRVLSHPIPFLRNINPGSLYLRLAQLRVRPTSPRRPSDRTEGYMTFGQSTIGQSTLGHQTIDQSTLDHKTIGHWTLGQVTIGHWTLSQMTIGQSTLAQSHTTQDNRSLDNCSHT